MLHSVGSLSTNVLGIPIGPHFKGQVSKKKGWPLKMAPIGSPKTSVLNQPTLCNISENDRIQVTATFKN
jgi:hypothetical protein